jgi:hypothetical protein
MSSGDVSDNLFHRLLDSVLCEAPTNALAGHAISSKKN